MSFFVRTLVLVLSLLGIADSAYLAYTKFADNPLICGPFTGCDVVAKSPYSDLFGIPLALYGLVFYVVIFFIVTFYRELGERGLKTLFFISGIGVMFSVYFLYVQIVKIDALCPYCALSAFISFALALLLGAWYLQSRRARTSEAPRPSDAQNFV